MGVIVQEDSQRHCSSEASSWEEYKEFLLFLYVDTACKNQESFMLIENAKFDSITHTSLKDNHSVKQSRQ